ncbi:MAG: polysaccharide biosynthesis C-terminal domain-containing protein [Planctomycetes bacterium]|nr:polysaccharide biosynthesis C-terminal domain-containing protein [Planctomycetota bacterium]
MIAKAVLGMTVVAIFCRLASLVKEAYVVFVFGPGAAMDAYSLVILVPGLMGALFLNAVRRAYLSQQPSHGAAGITEGDAFGDLFLSSLLLVSLALAVLFSAIIRPLLALAVPEKNPEVVEHVLRLAIPSVWLIVPMTLVTALSSILNARQQFSAPQATHLLPPALIALFVYQWGGQSVGPDALVWGLLAGTALQGAALLGIAWRSHHAPRLRLRGYSRALRSLWSLSAPIILLEVLVYANSTVDRSMAASLPPGRVSILYWSLMMKDFISGTLVASLLLVLLPHFSEQVAAGATGELRRSCAQIIRYGAMTMFPLSVLLVVCGPPLFQQIRFGKLGPEAAVSIATCLAAYGLGLFGEFVGGSMVQALMALKRIGTLVWLGIFAYFLPNLLFNLLLIGPLGEVGVALSSALVAYTTTACNYLALRRAVGIEEEARNLRIVVGCLLAAAVMATVSFGVRGLARQIGDGSAWADLASVLAGAAIGLAVYLWLLLVYPGCEEARKAWAIIEDKLRSFGS